MKPKISMVMTSLNPRAELIERAIDSASAFDEIVIHIDAGSKEPVYRPKDREKLRFVEFDKSLTIFQALNLLVEKSSGDYFSVFCDDDEYHPATLKEIIDLMHEGKFTDADVVHFPCSVNGSGSWGHTPGFTFHQIMDANCVTCSSFVKKELWEKLNGFQIIPACDWDFWARAKKHCARFEFFPKDVYDFRVGNPRSLLNRSIAELGPDGVRKAVIENVNAN